ncbi:MAG: hypothetical protein R3B48_28480 [Kofleriaceae bacterium]
MTQSHLPKEPPSSRRHLGRAAQRATIAALLTACYVVPAKTGTVAAAPSAAPSPAPPVARAPANAEPSSLEDHARAASRDLTDLLAALGGYLACFDAKLLERAISNADAAYAKRLQQSPCLVRMGALAAERGYQTVTVGISGGGSFGLGGFVDTGFAFDTRGRHAPTLYQTKAISIGIQAGGGVGLNLGLYRGSSAVDTAGSDTHGVTFEGGAGAGAGMGIWYKYDGTLDGVSVSAIAGASGKAGAYARINTTYYDLAGRNPVVCGGVGQNACKAWQRIPSCDAGLREDLRAGVCRTEEQFPCGGAGERACKLWERIPSCNRGLHENLLQGKCYRPAPKPKLACGARGQRPCKLWERIPSCNRGLHENFFAGRCQ